VAKTPQRQQKLLFGSTLVRNVDSLVAILGSPKPDEEPPEVLLIRQTFDMEYWLEEIGNDYKRLRKAPEELKADRDVVLAAIQQSPQAFKFASDALRADKEVAMAAVSKDVSLVDFMSLDLWEDLDLMMVCVPRRPNMYRHLSHEMRMNRELTWRVCEVTGDFLRHVPLELARDRDLALHTARHCLPRGVRQNSLLDTLGQQNSPHAGDKEVVLACAAVSRVRLRDVAEELREDLEVVRAILATNPDELQHAPTSIFEGNREFLISVLQQNGRGLEFAGELKDDREAVEAALTNYPCALKFASERFRADRNMALLSLDSWFRAKQQPASTYHVEGSQPLEFMSRELRADKQIVMQSVQIKFDSLKHAEASLRADPDVIRKAVAISGMALEYALSSADLAEDSNVNGRRRSAKAGYKKTVPPPEAGHPLNDVDFLVEVVTRSRAALQFVPKHLRREVEERLPPRKGLPSWYD